ncbi:hypothetical protein C8R43DRAFT_305531 [Mycena crocata]|nr:hypothetical protein C8R43DRAFT_305531 [Mycena crocata]
MPHHHYPSDSTNTLYATSPPPSYDDQDYANTPRASEFLPGYSAPQLPPPDAEMEWHWREIPNMNRSGRFVEDEVQADATSGRPSTHDAGTRHQPLNANAPEFRPAARLASAARPASAASSNSRASSMRSSTFARAASSSSLTSMDISRASTPAAQHKSPAQGTALTLAAGGPIPQYPQIHPGEQVFAAYRELLCCAVDQSTPISTLLELRLGGMGNYERTQCIALLAHRLSAYAPCSAAEFRVFLRAEALRLMSMHWQAPESSSITSLHGRYDSLNTPEAGLTIAAFMGSLFRHKMISVHDVHHCLSMLISANSGGPTFLKLQAAHAILVHGGQGICAAEVSPEFDRLCTHFTAFAPDGNDNDTFIWGPDAESHELLADVHETLDRYIASSQMQGIHAGVAGLSTPSATARRR